MYRFPPKMGDEEWTKKTLSKESLNRSANSMGFVTLRSLFYIVPGILLFIGLYLAIRTAWPDLSLWATALIWFGAAVLMGIIGIALIMLLFKDDSESHQDNGQQGIDDDQKG